MEPTPYRITKENADQESYYNLCKLQDAGCVAVYMDRRNTDVPMAVNVLKDSCGNIVKVLGVVRGSLV